MFIFLIFLLITINIAKPQNGEYIRKKREIKYTGAKDNQFELKWCVDSTPFEKINLENIKAAIKMISENSCIKEKFDPTCSKPSEGQYLIFKDETNNRVTDYNYNGTKLDINVPFIMKIEYHCNRKPGCIAKKIIMYLGLLPAHKRKDRDGFISVNKENVYPDFRDEYDIVPDSDLGNIGYDYGSITQVSNFYHQYFFNRTFSTNPKEYSFVTGQEYKPSFTDIKWLNNQYCLKACEKSLDCKNGGFINSQSCDKCDCPTGYTGQTCEEIKQSDDDCGKTILSATTDTQTLKISGKKKCYYQIKANGGKINIVVEKGSVPTFNPCFENQALEIKHRKDKTLTGLCLCTYIENTSLTSEDDMVLIFYTGESINNMVEIKYQQVDN